VAEPLDSAFEAFDIRIRTTRADQRAASTHAEAVCGALEQQDFVIECFPVGSTVRGTAVRGISDVDLLVTIRGSRDDFSMRPEQIIDLVSETLAESHFEVSRDAVAITLGFPEPPSVDVIPAIPSGSREGHPVFWIGTETLSWQEYAPSQQDLLIITRTEQVGPRLKSIIRMLKVWNSIQGGPFNSSDIETLACEAFQKRVPSYSEAIRDALDLAVHWTYNDNTLGDHGLRLAPHRKPTPASLRVLTSAQLTAHSAQEAEKRGESGLRHAVSLWRGMFGDKFPANFD
jgi:hypothetical protein